ncbi:LytR/AlgR family response regulator transcription factor [Flavobacterium pallidum]|uniref:DNA-binding response regulator n=1 Tax=Flavobacterium pallidum TaxID=2172098 RepID=A0A2S1SK36_9FLAO|nr:LytTR family DNA-binding domain-containing protein [Flavobacterium pallidum]AWI26745.1 DNA-binding response regulator [Flavobacterium pallidum]
MNLMPINSIIVSKDSESIAMLRNFEKENAIILQITGVADGADEGVALTYLKRPDLIFLDGKVDTTLFFNQLGRKEFNIPKVIVISTDYYDAVKAFTYNAVDFILKPAGFNVIMMAMYKVIKRIEMERSLQNQNVEKVSRSSDSAKGFVAVSSLDKIELLQMSDILFCKSDGRYTVFHLSDGRKVTSSRNLGEYSKILDDNFFFRVHNSYIVNLLHVKQIVKKDGYFCEFAAGLTVPVATRRQEEFQKFMKL